MSWSLLRGRTSGCPSTRWAIPTTGVVHLTARFGFQDDQDIPRVLVDAFMLTEEIEVDPDTPFYFLSRITIELGSRGGE